MKVLLKVGHSSYLLASDAGLQTVVKALSQAVECMDYSYRRKNAKIVARTDALEVSVKYLSPKTRIEFTRDIYSPDEPEESEQLRLAAPTAIIIPPTSAS